MLKRLKKWLCFLWQDGKVTQSSHPFNAASLASIWHVLSLRLLVSPTSKSQALQPGKQSRRALRGPCDQSVRLLPGSGGGQEVVTARLSLECWRPFLAEKVDPI